MSALLPTPCDVAWDLSPLFSGPDDPQIEQTWAEAERLADDFGERYRGNVAGLTPDELRTALQELEHVHDLAGKPAYFAQLRYAADTSDPQNGAFMQAQMERSSALSVKLMFFDLELQALSEEDAGKVIESPELATYRHHLERVRVYAPYRLSEPEEKLMEELSNTGSRAWVRLHDELFSNQVFRFQAPGSEQVEELSQEEVIDKLYDPNREVRLAAATAMTEGLKQLERPICYTYNTLLADKRLSDRLRRYEYAEQSRHLGNELDKPTVDMVMRLCRERGEAVARYYHTKREVLGLPELTHVDRYAPLFDTVEQKSWEEAKTMVLEAYGAFHPALSESAQDIFDSNWIDAAPRKGKTGGAFCAAYSPNGNPFLLQSYLGKLGDVMTLAHEMGHGVHAYLGRKQTMFNYGTSLAVAELASIFGEMLVFDKVVKDATPRDQLSLYGKKIEGIFASVYRQAAMFRFEQRCHTHRREKGELTHHEFSDIWQDELQSMFGDAVKLGEDHRVWWLYVGHFFFAPFYVYAYSFGELLTMALYQKAKHAGPEFAEKYVDVLSLSGSIAPYDLMAKLGADLRDESFWTGGFDAIDEMVGQFESLWSTVKG